MLTTRFTELVGCSVPIQQAGMASHAKPGLAAAVANAGGLGMVSVYSKYGGPPANVAKMLENTREQTAGVFGANFIMRFVEPDLAHETVRAAGGIGSGRAMAAVLAAGADGVRVGTRFLAVQEAEAHPGLSAGAFCR